jgi:SSS family solute:Na+ symporter
MLGVLGMAALGSGAAVLRAMVSALQAAWPRCASMSGVGLAAIAMSAAAALTATGLPIVDTMVSVNIVYIASVGVSLFCLLRGKDGDETEDTWVIAAGFLGSVAAFVPTWVGASIPNVELIALLVGLTSATAARVVLHRWHGEPGRRALRRY